MKKLYARLIAFLCLVALPLGLWAQPQITMYMSFDPPFPPNQFPLDYQAWASGEQDIFIAVNNPGPEIMVTFEVTIRYENDLVLRIYSCNSFLLPHGTTLYDRDNPPPYGLCFEPNLGNPVITSTITSGVLPTGKWEICIAITYTVGTTVFTIGPPCSEVEVEPTSYQPPTLLMPSEGQTFTYGTAIQFTWTPVTPTFGFTQDNLLQIYEVHPTQDAIQAMRFNLPLVEQQVTGSTFWMWPLTSMQVMPGDCVHYVCVVRPQAPAVLLGYPNGGSSEQVEFWVKDPRPPVIPYVAPCDSIDIGPDHILDSPAAPAVRIGCLSKPGYAYLWTSDPTGFQAYQSEVQVRPQVTTRYVLYQTDPTGTCVVHDEAYVVVRDAFQVRLEVDPCGQLQPVLITAPSLPTGDPEASTRSSGTTGPARRGVAFTLNDVDYDAEGKRLDGSPAPPNSCVQPAPPPRSAPPSGQRTYRWSTGETASSIHPSTDGTYSCTVTDGPHSAVGSTTYRASQRLHGDPPQLVYTDKVYLGDPQRPFILWQRGDGLDSLAAYNATAYELVISCRNNGYQQKIKGTTTTGFRDGEIRWDGSPDPGGVPAIPGDYTAKITLLNCTHTAYDPRQRYKVAHVRDATVAVRKATGQERTAVVEFVVKKAKRVRGGGE